MLPGRVAVRGRPPDATMRAAVATCMSRRVTVGTGVGAASCGAAGPGVPPSASRAASGEHGTGPIGMQPGCTGCCRGVGDPTKPTTRRWVGRACMHTQAHANM
eukprot:358226-Chlamydomonas_euryale.AAC.1